VQTEAFVIFLGNKINIFSAVLIFGSRSMVALDILQIMRPVVVTRSPIPAVVFGMLYKWNSEKN